VNLSTGAVTPIDRNRIPPFGGRVTASLDGGLGGRLRIDRGGRAVLDADPRGAYGVAWQVERDGLLFFSLYRDAVQTYEAIRMDSLPHLDAVWCRSIGNDGPGNSRGAFMTAHGPLLVRLPHAFVAIRPSDGETLWQMGRTDTGAPFTLLESGDDWIACDTDVIAVERATGRVRWRRGSADIHTPVDCTLVGRQVLTATRHCDATGCTPRDVGALDPATGAQLFTSDKTDLRPLVSLDDRHALVVTGNGVAIFDARTGAFGPTLPLAGAQIMFGESLADGDVLVWSGEPHETLRLSTEPLAIRWQVPDAYGPRVGDLLLAARSEPATGSSWLVTIDVASGAERVIALPQAPPLPGQPAPRYELGGPTILGTSATEVYVSIWFGFYGH